MKKIFFAFCAIIIIALSCKKDKNDEPPAITLQNLAGDYKFTAITLNYKGKETNYLDSLFTACEKDDIMTLKTNKSYSWTDAGTKCSPVGNYPDGTWDLPSTTKFLWDNDVYDLDKYDGKALEFSYSFADSIGQLAKLSYKFQRQ